MLSIRSTMEILSKTLTLLSFTKRSSKEFPFVCNYARLWAAARNTMLRGDLRLMPCSRERGWLALPAVDLGYVGMVHGPHTRDSYPTVISSAKYLTPRCLYWVNDIKKKPIAFTRTKTYLATKMISGSSFFSTIIPAIGVKINGGNSL